MGALSSVQTRVERVLAASQEALVVLKILFASLKEHELDELVLSDNALGLKGVTAAADALVKQKNLRRLYFNNNGLQAGEWV